MFQRNISANVCYGVTVNPSYSYFFPFFSPLFSSFVIVEAKVGKGERGYDMQKMNPGRLRQGFSLCAPQLVILQCFKKSNSFYRNPGTAYISAGRCAVYVDPVALTINTSLFRSFLLSLTGIYLHTFIKL